MFVRRWLRRCGAVWRAGAKCGAGAKHRARVKTVAIRQRAGALRGGPAADRGRGRGTGRVADRAPGDRGMTTAEYALGTLAACAAAAMLYKVMSGDAMEAAVRSLIGKALGVHV
ncbi:DUF4244 domain-containing protein [Streptomyces sp. NPDC059788]|uniref:DUF4244 domain-containing protein n=1 Tax=Streptomyces sp. NPDC059788 TaxID=3346948 RepID=UPI00364B6A5E